jgi:prevent-host-death family protein
MEEVTIRDLRNHGGEVVDRVVAGERLTVTRAGHPVAELRPLPPRPLGATALLRRWRRLRPLDRSRLQADLDAVVDPRL